MFQKMMLRLHMYQANLSQKLISAFENFGFSIAEDFRVIVLSSNMRTLKFKVQLKITSGVTFYAANSPITTQKM